MNSAGPEFWEDKRTTANEKRNSNRLFLQIPTFTEDSVGRVICLSH
jgi:hypothetical protein